MELVNVGNAVIHNKILYGFKILINYQMKHEKLKKSGNLYKSIKTKNILQHIYLFYIFSPHLKFQFLLPSSGIDLYFNSILLLS